MQIVRRCYFYHRSATVYLMTYINVRMFKTLKLEGLTRNMQINSELGMSIFMIYRMRIRVSFSYML
jgi:hypothetical protein